MGKLKRSIFIEFDSIDASENPPQVHVNWRIMLDLEGILKQDGKCFRIEWHPKFKWLEYSILRQNPSVSSVEFSKLQQLLCWPPSSVVVEVQTKHLEKLISATGKNL